jgi:hypothetical protein
LKIKTLLRLLYSYVPAYESDKPVHLSTDWRERTKPLRTIVVVMAMLLKLKCGCVVEGMKYCEKVLLLYVPIIHFSRALIYPYNRL